MTGYNETLAQLVYEQVGGADVVRKMAKDANREMTEAMSRLPPSPERDRIIAMSEQVTKIFDEASDEFLRDWLVLVCLPMSGAAT